MISQVDVPRHIIFLVGENSFTTTRKKKKKKNQLVRKLENILLVIMGRMSVGRRVLTERMMPSVARACSAPRFYYPLTRFGREHTLLEEEQKRVCQHRSCWLLRLLFLHLHLDHLHRRRLPPRALFLFFFFFCSPTPVKKIGF